MGSAWMGLFVCYANYMIINGLGGFLIGLGLLGWLRFACCVNLPPVSTAAAPVDITTQHSFPSFLHSNSILQYPSFPCSLHGSPLQQQYDSVRSHLPHTQDNELAPLTFHTHQLQTSPKSAAEKRIYSRRDVRSHYTNGPSGLQCRQNH
jgi:hypothetical protein